MAGAWSRMRSPTSDDQRRVRASSASKIAFCSSAAGRHRPPPLPNVAAFGGQQRQRARRQPIRVAAPRRLDVRRRQVPCARMRKRPDHARRASSCSASFIRPASRAGRPGSGRCSSGSCTVTISKIRPAERSACRSPRRRDRGSSRDASPSRASGRRRRRSSRETGSIRAEDGRHLGPALAAWPPSPSGTVVQRLQRQLAAQARLDRGTAPASQPPRRCAAISRS